MKEHSPLELVAHSARESARGRREEIVDLCSQLVAARSDNPPGDTRKVANVVRSALSSLGITSDLVSVNPMMPPVIAQLRNGSEKPHLVLNVHMDTMPAGDEDAWSVDPYALTRRDGKLYGLGMGNMKGSVAAMVHAFAFLNENRDYWRGRVTLTAVSDEVVFGPNGAEYLLEQFPELIGDGLICGEGPGFKRLSIAEKGVLWLAIEASGVAGHSSSVSAMSSATAKIAAIINLIDTMNGTLATPPDELVEHFEREDSGFQLSANVGLVESGTFIGQVATTGRAEVDFRVPPGMTIDEIQDTVAEWASKIPGVTVTRLKGWNPNWTSPTSELCQAWRDAENALSCDPAKLAIRLPASDASRWRAHSVPAICFGPQPSLSAGIDDYAEEEETLRCVEYFATTSVRFLRSHQKPKTS